MYRTAGCGCWVERNEGDGSLFLPGEPLLTHGAAVTIRLRAGRVWLASIVGLHWRTAGWVGGCCSRCRR